MGTNGGFFKVLAVILLIACGVWATAMTAEDIVEFINGFTGGVNDGFRAEISQESEFDIWVDVIVSGKMTDVNQTLALTISKDVRVLWEAEFSGNAIDLIQIIHSNEDMEINGITYKTSGLFEVVDGAVLETTHKLGHTISNGEWNSPVPNGGFVKISGGIVKATGNEGCVAIANYGGVIQILGGMIETSDKLGFAIFNQIGHVEMFGGIVKAADENSTAIGYSSFMGSGQPRQTDIYCTANRDNIIGKVSGNVFWWEHNFQTYTETQAATCVAGGKETATCGFKYINIINCEEKRTRDIPIDPNAHDWIDNWVITKEPTCISKGNRKRECNIVGCSVEEHDNNTGVLPINANAHDWGNWINKTPATCTDKATEERICRHSSEHKETQDVGEALGHSWSEKITIPATCETEGSETRNCNRYGCGVSDVKTLPKLQGAECATSIVDTEKSNDKYGIRFAVNPVSDKAEISVNLPNGERATETKVVVYDMTGNVVYSGASTASTGSATTPTGGAIVWDLRNTAGRFVANGTYLVIAEVKDRSGRTHTYSSRLGVKR